MRDYLCRGKRVDNGKYAFGYYVEKKSAEGDLYVIENDKESHIVDPKTVGQFIGLKDKNNMMIFDGDIFTVMGRSPKLVKFIDKIAAFCIANVEQLKDEKYVNIWGPMNEVWWNDFRDYIEVIGNIHDNPELLKGGEND